MLVAVEKLHQTTGSRLEGLQSGLHELARQEVPFSIPMICCQEVLQGARDEGNWRKLEDYLLTQDLVAPTNPVRTHVDAARIFYDCRQKGLTVRSSVDCYIAQLVLERDAHLLHEDEDFTRISRVRPLRIWKP